MMEKDLLLSEKMNFFHTFSHNCLELNMEKVRKTNIFNLSINFYNFSSLTLVIFLFMMFLCSLSGFVCSVCVSYYDSLRKLHYWVENVSIQHLLSFQSLIYLLLNLIHRFVALRKLNSAHFNFIRCNSAIFKFSKRNSAFIKTKNQIQLMFISLQLFWEVLSLIQRFEAIFSANKHF